MSVARFTQSATEIQSIFDAVENLTIYGIATETTDGLESSEDKTNLNKLSMTDDEITELYNMITA